MISSGPLVSDPARGVEKENGCHCEPVPVSRYPCVTLYVCVVHLTFTCVTHHVCVLMYVHIAFCMWHSMSPEVLCMCSL